MPHSKTGREVNIGDKVFGVERYGDFPGNPVGGTVIAITEGETCNALVVPFGTPTQYVTLKNTVHVDDLTDFTPA